MSLVYFFLLLINILVGFFILSSNYKRSETIFFSIWILGTTIWIFSNYQIFNTIHFLFWNKMAYFGATIVVVGLLGFFFGVPLP